jgi:hypothetical protein
MRHGIFLLAALLLPSLSYIPHGGAALATAPALATWQGTAEAVQTRSDRVTVIGTFTSMLLISRGNGRIASGRMICPTVLKIGMADASLHGSGSCAYTASDGARAFGDWTCSGTRGRGCRGEFTLSGGTARLAGVKGRTRIAFQAPLELTQAGDRTLTDHAMGTAEWEDLGMLLRALPAAR